jgi:hypothetical protein
MKLLWICAAGFLFCAMLTVGQQSEALKDEPLGRSRP